MTDTEQEEIDAAWAEVLGETPATTADGDEEQGEAAAEDTAAAEEAGDTEAEAAETNQDDAAPDGPLSTAPETTPHDDAIWANAPAELKAAYEAARKRAETAEHRLKSDAGRVASFQRKAGEFERKLGVIVGAGQQEDLKAYFESEGYKKAKEDYGTDLGPVFTMLERLAENTASTQQAQGRMIEQHAAEVASEIEGWLNEEAPDRFDLFRRDDFEPWLNTQAPRYVREIAKRNWDGVVDPAEVVEVCDKFRAHLGMVRPTQDTSVPEQAEQPQTTEIDRRREVQLQGSKSVKSRAPIVAGADENDEDTAWNEAVAAINRERAAARR